MHAAIPYLEECAAIMKDEADPASIAFILEMMAWALVSENPGKSMQIAGAVDGIKDVFGGEAPPGLTRVPDLRALANDAGLAPEEIDEHWQEGRNMSAEEALGYAFPRTT